MRRTVLSTALVAIGIAIGLVLGTPAGPASNAVPPGNGFAAVAGERGGQDLFGAYDVVPDWPKPLSQLPGHDDWTWGTMTGVAADTPDRTIPKSTSGSSTTSATPSTNFPTTDWRSQDFVDSRQLRPREGLCRCPSHPAASAPPMR